MPGDWSYLLCDRLGNALAELSHADGKTVTRRRNGFHEAAATLSVEDPAAQVLVDTLNSGQIPTLKAYRDHVLRFNGALAPFQDQAEDAATMSLVFRSPFSLLIGDGPGHGIPYSPEAVGASFTATEQTAIVSTIVDLYLGFSLLMPLGLGTITPTGVLRDRTYERGQNVGQLIIDLANVLDGFEFVDRPVETQAGAWPGQTIYGVLDMAPMIGQNRPEARFEYGKDTLANCRSISRQWSLPVTRAEVYGGNGLYGIATTSNAGYGFRFATEQRPDVTIQSTLNARAQSMLRPGPTRTLQIAPDPALAPRPWDDFDLGDTVQIYARRGAVVEDTPARVNGYTVTIDDNGREAYAIPDPQLPDEEAEIRSELLVTVQAAS